MKLLDVLAVMKIEALHLAVAFALSTVLLHANRWGGGGFGQISAPGKGSSTWLVQTWHYIVKQPF